MMAGTPATTTFEGTGLITTALAAMITSSPIVVSPMILAPEPIQTLSPIFTGVSLAYLS